MSHTVQITVPDALYITLREAALRTGQPIEVVAFTWLHVAAQQLASDPLEPFIGLLDSGGSDWANNHDEHLGQEHTTVSSGDS